MPSVLVCDTQATHAQTIAKLLADVTDVAVVYLAGLTEAGRYIREGKAELLVIGPSVAEDDALLSVTSIRDAGSASCIVWLPPKVDQGLLRSALRVGVDDVVSSSAPGAEIKSALLEALGKVERRGGPRKDASAQTPAGEVITVLSMKGGVGKTVVASNLAVALASLGKSVALIDLDLQFGDVGIMLGLEPAQTIVGAVQSGERLDAPMLRGFLIEHSSGVQVLLAPLSPEDAEIVTASRIDRIIGLLIAMFDFVVIDTPPALDEAVLTALDRSNRIMMITMMDVASVKNSRVSLQKLRQLGYKESIIDIMLNRADSKVYLKAEEVEQAIGMPIKYRLPSDLQIPRSVNKGMPVVLDAPRSQPAKVILETAKAILSEHAEVSTDVA